MLQNDAMRMIYICFRVISGYSSRCFSSFLLASFIEGWVSKLLAVEHAHDGIEKGIKLEDPAEMSTAPIPHRARSWRRSPATSPLLFIVMDLFCCLFLLHFHPRINRSFWWEQVPASPFTEALPLCPVEHGSAAFFIQISCVETKSPGSWIPSLPPSLHTQAARCFQTN